MSDDALFIGLDLNGVEDVFIIFKMFQDVKHPYQVKLAVAEGHSFRSGLDQSG
jgi:hypothetical protein